MNRLFLGAEEFVIATLNLSMKQGAIGLVQLQCLPYICKVMLAILLLIFHYKNTVTRFVQRIKMNSRFRLLAQATMILPLPSMMAQITNHNL
ncbi:unnamed protein product, partial [Iphiclides podalirius]